MFIPLIFENDLFYYQLCIDLPITFIILSHRVWCDHLSKNTNPEIQKLYPTVCVCACVCALSTYVGMYKCMNIEYLYIYAHWSFIQPSVQANHVFLLFQELRKHRPHTTRAHRKTRAWTPILHQNKSQNLSANYVTFCLSVVNCFLYTTVFCPKLESY
jgi:hypothetical protein